MKFKHLIAATIFATSLAVSFGVASKVENPVIEEAEAADYYASITDSMSGSTLQSALKSIINTNSVSVSYDWSRYEAADEDPNNSNNVILVYARTSVAKSAHVSGNTGWNREHTFPASKLSNSQAEKDNHIIFASDNKVNGARSNIKMGVVTGGTVVNDYNGNATTCRKTSSLFDPNNVARGIVARSTMYAAAMYDYDPEDNFESIATMLRWHLEYQPTSQDITRNNTVYSNQKNRNPFVDHPEYACRIWGNTNSTTQSICAAASTGVTISSTAETINVGGTAQISATSSDSSAIAWTSSNSSVATVSSDSASSGSNITITGVASGSATITARATINSTQYTATCAVTVSSSQTKLATPQPQYNNSNKQVTWAPISNASSYQVKVDSGSYTTGASPYSVSSLSLNTIHIVYVKAIGNGTTYSDSDAGSVQFTPTSGGGGTSQVTINFDSGGNCSSTSGEFDGVSFTTSQSSGTNQPAYNSNSYELRMYYSSSGNGNTFTLTPDDNYSITGVVITASSTSYTPTVKYNVDNGDDVQGTWSSTTMTISNISASSTFVFRNANTTSTQLRIKSVAVSLESSGSSSPTLTGITLDTTNVKTAFTVNESFTYSGLVVTANYSDSSSETISSGYTVSTPDLSSTGNKTVTVTYSGQSANYQITVSAAAITSISASVSKTYYVGETISASDITVKDNNNNTIESFSFANDDYKFTYADASSGGSLTSKIFKNAIECSNLTCDLTVQVQRKEYVQVSSVSWVATAYASLNTGDQVVVVGNNGSDYAMSNDGGTSNAPSATAVTISSNKLTGEIPSTIQWTVTKTGSDIQFGTSSNFLYATNSNNGLRVGSGENNVFSIDSDYLYNSQEGRYIGIYNSQDWRCYTSINNNIKGQTFTFFKKTGNAQSPENVANYIMYEDTNNQCLTKFTTVKGYFEGLSSSERNTFMTSSDYVISTARERLKAWARHQGKTIDYVDGDYSISNISRIPVILSSSISNTTIIVVVTVGIAVIAIGGYFLLRKKKED